MSRCSPVGSRGLRLEDGEEWLALHTLLLLQFEQLLSKNILVALTEPGKRRVSPSQSLGRVHSHSVAPTGCGAWPTWMGDIQRNQGKPAAAIHGAWGHPAAASCHVYTTLPNTHGICIQFSSQIWKGQREEKKMCVRGGRGKGPGRGSRMGSPVMRWQSLEKHCSRRDPGAKAL